MPLAQCIKKGDLYAFDQALKEGEDEFVKRRIYLPLERAHDTCLRNLLRKVFIAGGMAPDVDPPIRRTRIPIAEFTAAISLSSKQQVDSDEVECLLANMIYKVSRCLLTWTITCHVAFQAYHFHSPHLHSVHVFHTILPFTQLTRFFNAGVHEGIHSPSAADRGAEQKERCISGYRSLNGTSAATYLLANLRPSQQIGLMVYNRCAPCWQPVAPRWVAQGSIVSTDASVTDALPSLYDHGWCHIVSQSYKVGFEFSQLCFVRTLDAEWTEMLFGRPKPTLNKS